MKFLFLQVAFLFASSVGKGQDIPRSANEIMKEAFDRAAKEHKNVFVIFHASWCGWCHQMDSSMNDSSCKQYFNDSYVIRHLVVYESRGKEDRENPGAMYLLRKYYGDEQGIPFWMIFDKSGNLLASSRSGTIGNVPKDQGENVGCPATDKEVNYFIAVLKNTSVLDAEQEDAIRKRFSRNNE